MWHTSSVKREHAIARQQRMGTVTNQVRYSTAISSPHQTGKTGCSELLATVTQSIPQDGDSLESQPTSAVEIAKTEFKG